jgi:hypothetical protein
MTSYYPEDGEWVVGYGGKLSHLVVRKEHTNGNMGTYRTFFACGVHSDFVRDQALSNSTKCNRCVNADRKNRIKDTDLVGSNPGKSITRYCPKKHEALWNGGYYWCETCMSEYDEEETTVTLGAPTVSVKNISQFSAIEMLIQIVSRHLPEYREMIDQAEAEHKKLLGK